MKNIKKGDYAGIHADYRKMLIDKRKSVLSGLGIKFDNLAKMGRVRMVEIIGLAAADQVKEFLADPENRAELEALQSLALTAGN